ncbi:MAG: hypothetical protein ABS81_03505 [Pseudonocardia sp. SCN 72-86]|nr:MAG: hypothetical protein ABS81_03505 [Pseudonocardia sp. SCN 72-86]
MLTPSYPWWLEEALGSGQEEPPAAPHVGRTQADVVIVGAGYTGLWAALALHERNPDLEVVLLERDIVGAGPSGRNGGFLHGYWEQLPGLVDAFGKQPALDLAHAGSTAQKAILGFATARGEDIWATESGIMMVATSEAQEAALDRAIANARRLGVTEQVEPLSHSEVASRCASSAFGRGVLFHEAGTVQPARLARALRRAVLDAGVRLYENTRVVDITDGASHRVITDLGEIECRDVVLATNSALATDTIGRKSLVNLSSYMCVTEPIPDRLKELGWTNGEGIRDARMFLHYFRATQDGRIAFGAGSGPIGYRGGKPDKLCYDQATVSRMCKEFGELFPELRDVEMTHAWGGPIDMASDHAPIVHTKPASRIHYAMGLSGHGVNPSWIVGQIVASLVDGRRDRWTALPICRISAPGLPPEPFRYIGGRAVRSAIMQIEASADSGERPPLWARVGADLPRRLGVRVGTRR